MHCHLLTACLLSSSVSALAIDSATKDQHVLSSTWRTSLFDRVVTPDLCPDNTTQYSGYLAGSDLFFWFFPSRSDPATDPIGVWSNGGPGSSALTGMQYAGPCEVVEDGNAGYKMKRREWSLNQQASILMIDNPRGAGFSFAPFPVVHSVYDSAKDLYQFLQSFMQTFPQYTANPLAINSLSYGGHYAPAYSSYIQHKNAQLEGIDSLWTDIWPLESASVQRKNRVLNLTSISIGNGWMNKQVQYPALLDFVCGGATDRGIPFLADKSDCAWSRKRIIEGLELLRSCNTSTSCVAASMYTQQAAGFPYQELQLNPYDYRQSAPYDEAAVVAFYGSAPVQAQLGVITSAESPPRHWQAHSSRVHMEYVYSGDWDLQTDMLIERLLRSGISVLKYEGMVDWICNYIGIRKIMSNLPNYKNQEMFNNLSMQNWTLESSNSSELSRRPSSSYSAGSYKCLHGDKHGSGRDSGSMQKGNLCYLELEGAGHIASLDKPYETSMLLGGWMHKLSL